MEWNGYGDEDYQGKRMRGSRRSEPGAPMALERPSLTDPLKWENQFRRRDSQITADQLPGALAQRGIAPRPAPAAVTPQNVRDAIGSFASNLAPNPFAGEAFSFSNSFRAPAPAAPPSLSTMAGGQNHAQNWMTRATAGRAGVEQYRDRTKPAFTLYTKPTQPQEEDLSGRGLRWGSAFR